MGEGGVEAALYSLDQFTSTETLKPGLTPTEYGQSSSYTWMPKHNAEVPFSLGPNVNASFLPSAHTRFQAYLMVLGYRVEKTYSATFFASLTLVTGSENNDYYVFFALVYLSTCEYPVSERKASVNTILSAR